MWDLKQKRVYQFCKGGNSATVRFLQRGDGTMTSNAEEMDDLIRNAWLPIFCKYGHASEPSLQVFLERFHKYIDNHGMTLTDITGEELQKVLSRMSGSPGAD
eukprot:11840462-Karenia_brevis.AAC.1